jgi:prevent-host-death family protein
MHPTPPTVGDYLALVDGDGVAESLFRRQAAAKWTVAQPSAEPTLGTSGDGDGRDEITIIMVMSETLPLAEIKAHLSEIVDRVERQHERVVLTRNGRPAAVIMSPADLEALEDTLDLLSDPKALKEITAARNDTAKGQVVTADELRAKYLHK